jgi:uncharacterized protein YbcI
MMSGDPRARAPSERGEQAAQISREMVKLMRKIAGRGPTRARTTIGRDHVLVMFQDTLTPGERNLVEHGYGDKVQEVRTAYQDVLKDPATEMIEAVLGRKVVGFMSANHFEPDIAAEVFALDATDLSGDGTPQEAEHTDERE